MDQDGRSDLLSASAETCSATLLLGVGSGQFSGSPLVYPDIGTALGVASIDLDADGRRDFLVAAGSDDKVDAFVQVSPRQWRQASSFGGIGETRSPSKIAVLDADANGRQDIAILNNDDVVLFFSQ